MEMSYEPNFTNNMNIGNWNPTSNVDDIWGQSYIAIRKANIFLENIGQLQPSPLAPADKIRRWRGEAIFLRAFYHFLLIRVYGPVPIIDKSVGLDADFLDYKRQPIVDCVNFITSQCDSAIALLEPRITAANDFGRPDQTTALALKARVLLYMASPLWNGGTSLTDKDGQELFPNHDDARWQTAATAAKACIDQAESVGHKLYRPPPTIPNSITRKYSIIILMMKFFGQGMIRVTRILMHTASQEACRAHSGRCKRQHKILLMIIKWRMAHNPF